MLFALPTQENPAARIQPQTRFRNHAAWPTEQGTPTRRTPTPPQRRSVRHTCAIEEGRAPAQPVPEPVTVQLDATFDRDAERIDEQRPDATESCKAKHSDNSKK